MVLEVKPPAEGVEIEVCGPGRFIREPTRQLLDENLVARVTLRIHIPAEHREVKAVAGLVRDAAGNFYGLANGNVFKLDSTGKESVLFTFTGNDGQASGDLVQDAGGNLYGVTTFGTSGEGEVFKLTTPPDFAVAAFKLTPATVNAGGSASSAV